MSIIIAVLCLLAFVANVAIGAITGTPPVDNLVAEMLTLFAASIAFVVFILKREAQEREKANNTN